MKIDCLNFYRCPVSFTKLNIDANSKIQDDEVIEGFLINGSGEKFLVSNGIPDFTNKSVLIGDAAFARKYYAGIADTYDENVDITFKLYNEREMVVRNKLIDLLGIEKEDKILEVSCGTGKDAEIIVSKLSGKGHLTCLDISPEMITQACKKLKGYAVPRVDFVIASACALPFEDNTFNKLFCFAGIGHFPDIRKGLAEMTRVVKPGGKVVFCEKNVPPWLKQTEYGKILINNNPMFDLPVPLEDIPVEARDVSLRWVNGNVHYVVDYTVGCGEPKGNFDLELPGARGGTFNTRYHGKLEGVTPEVKELAIEAREKLGISMHKWLNDLIRSEAESVLDNDGAKK